MNILTFSIAFSLHVFDLNNVLSIQQPKYKTSNSMSRVYITKNCELYISLTTRYLALKFWLIIGRYTCTRILTYHCKYDYLKSEILANS